jgi:KDO2-lipid IV(A) lauroyltransferase
VARLASAGVNIFPVNDTLRLLAGLGGAWAQAPPNRKRLDRAVSNIAWAFPSLREEACRAMAVDAYRHLFALAGEFATSPRALTRDGMPMRVRFGDMGEALAMLNSGSPCLLVTGHCGNWEALGGALGSLGFRLHALYRPLDVRALDQWVQRSRGAMGLGLVSKFGAARRLPRLVEAGHSIGFIADQNAGDRGLFVPFFDRLASAYKTIGLLAMRYEAPIICGHTIRQGHPTTPRFDHVVHIADIIKPEEWADQPDPLFYLTARYRFAIERMVRRAPQQYLWMHRYWKSRPAFERSGKAVPERMIEKMRALPWMDEPRLERIVERSRRDAALSSSAR